MDVWEDEDSEGDFYFSVYVTEISGVAQAGDVIAITAESHRRKGTPLLFLVTFDINSDVNLSFRASRRNSVKKVKVHIQ